MSDETHTTLDGDTTREMLDRLRQRKRKGDELRRERAKLSALTKHKPHAARPLNRRGRR